MMPSAMVSQRMIPPKMLTSTPFTCGSDRMILNASVDPFLGRAAADVEEVGGLAALELDDVHGGHGEAGAVDHAADGAVELHVREPEPRGLHLGGLLLVEVAQRGDVGMAEQRVVLETDLGVEAEQIALLGHHQRVDLDQARVLVEEQLVEARDQSSAHCLARRPSSLSAEAIMRPWKALKPEAGSTVSVAIFSGVLAATFSMFTPPSVEAMNATRPEPRSTSSER